MPMSPKYFPVRQSLPKHNVNLIAHQPKKLKELICTKINSTGKDELAYVYAIIFRTGTSRIMKFIGMTKSKLK